MEKGVESFIEIKMIFAGSCRIYSISHLYALTERLNLMILTTKLHVPEMRIPLVSRPQLMSKLNLGMNCKLTLVTAPAGFGKTTLLSEWIKNNQKSIAWLSLDKQDNDIVRFWSYVVHAVGSAWTEFGDQVDSILTAFNRSTLESTLTTLINEMSRFTGDLVLILDDFHLIEDDSIHQSFASLLIHMPANIHLYILSRSEPPMALSKLRASHQLNQLDQRICGSSLKRESLSIIIV
jgi:LuxR family maltose regulon positive regulatory protein